MEKIDNRKAKLNVCIYIPNILIIYQTNAWQFVN